jgi:hypothetical protein
VIPRNLQIAIAALVLAILGMGSYMIYLKRRAESHGVTPVVARPQPPVSGPAAQLMLYVADDEDDALRPEHISLKLPPDPSERARVLLHALMQRYQQKDSPHAMPEGADVHNVYLLDPASAVVNLTLPIQQQNSGVEAEQLTLFSLVRTLKADQPQINRVHFLVDGHPADYLAGHADLSGWLETGVVLEATKELN